MGEAPGWTRDELMRAALGAARPTGVWLLPRSWCRRLHLWSARDQRACPHPGHRVRSIHGDERNRGYRWQCMECGVFAR